MTQDVFIIDGVRTPVGAYRGALSGVRPDDLAALVLRQLVERNPSLDPAMLEDVYMGAANGAGEDNRNVARMAVLLAGLPVSVSGATVNRLCGSGLEAVVEGFRAIAVGDARSCMVGGVESMSRAPWVLPKPEQPFPRSDETLSSTTLGWRLVNPAMPLEWTVPLGEGAELLADRYAIARSAQDAFALRSHRNAAAAWDGGEFSAEVVPVPGVDLVEDESIRRSSTADGLAALRPVFRANGTVTAGNASPSTTVRRRCCLGTWRPCGRSALIRSPVLRRPPYRASTRRSTGSARSRRRTRRSGGPGSAGGTWRRSS